MAMHRAFTCCFLLLCLAAPVLLSYGWLQHQRAVVRKEQKRQIAAGLDEDTLVLLKFSEKDSRTLLRWEHSMEFEYQNQMYDVVETELRGDTVYYRCWLDQKESVLNRQIQDLVAKALEKSPENQQNQQYLAHFFKSLFNVGLPSWPVDMPEPEVVKPDFPSVLPMVSAWVLPSVPPPERG